MSASTRTVDTQSAGAYSRNSHVSEEFTVVYLGHASPRQKSGGASPTAGDGALSVSPLAAPKRTALAALRNDTKRAGTNARMAVNVDAGRLTNERKFLSSEGGLFRHKF